MSDGLLDFLCPSWGRPRDEQWSSGYIPPRKPLAQPTLERFDADILARAQVEGHLKLYRRNPTARRK